MIRRPVRVLLNLLTASLLLGGTVAVVECVLLARESAARREASMPLDEAGMLLPSASVHHVLKPGAVLTQTRADGAVTKVTINSFGIRGTEPQVPVPDGCYRVVLLGDDTMFAPDVPEALTAARQLQSLLESTLQQPVEVINAAVPGYCPLLSLLQFRQRLTLLRPDLVVLHFDASDVADDRCYRPHLRMGSAGQSLACGHACLDSPQSRGQRSVSDFAIGRWLLSSADPAPESSFPRGQWLTEPIAQWQTHIRHSLAPVAELNQVLQELSVRLVLTTTPFRGGSDPDAGWRRQVEVLRTFSSRSGIEFCDPSHAFGQVSGDRLIVDGSRLSRPGHYALAVELAAQISTFPTTPPSIGANPVQQVSAEVPGKPVRRVGQTRTVPLPARRAGELKVVESPRTNNSTR